MNKTFKTTITVFECEFLKIRDGYRENMPESEFVIVKNKHPQEVELKIVSDEEYQKICEKEYSYLLYEKYPQINTLSTIDANRKKRKTHIMARMYVEQHYIKASDPRLKNKK